MRVRHTLSANSANSADSELAAAVDAITFVSRWIPYGGADSYEIYVTFGVTPAQFGQRLRRAADLAIAVAHLDLSAEEHDRLHAEAQRLSTLPWNSSGDNAAPG